MNYEVLRTKPLRVVAFRTHTYDCESRIYSLLSAGHQIVEEIVYDDESLRGNMHRLVERVHANAPDFSVIVGVHPEGYKLPCPIPHEWRLVTAAAPTAFICCDASDPPWWKWLDLYHSEKAFTCIVSIDGGENPIRTYDNGISLLSCNDARPFYKHSRPWEHRTARIAFSGHLGGRRDEIINGLRGDKLDFVDAMGGHISYEDMARFYCDHKYVINMPWTGSGQATHVKGRCLEAGYSKCVLFEHESSVFSNWFEPNIDYHAYNTAQDVRNILNSHSDDHFRDMAERFQKKMVDRHDPHRFWDAVTTKMGLVP